MSKVQLVTPIGSAEWFSLHKEDKFGNYTCVLHLKDDPETHKLVSKIEEMSQGGRKPITKEADGSFKVKLKLKSQGQKRDGSTYVINPPAIYDAFGKRIEGEKLASLNIGNGSQIRAKIELSSYNFMGQDGVSIKPKSVQIAKLVEFSGGGDSGFDALEFTDNDSEIEEDNYDF